MPGSVVPLAMFAKKTLDFGKKKIGYGFGGYPPPFTDKIFSEKGITDYGGYPPPFTNTFRDWGF